MHTGGPFCRNGHVRQAIVFFQANCVNLFHTSWESCDTLVSLPNPFLPFLAIYIWKGHHGNIIRPWIHLLDLEWTHVLSMAEILVKFDCDPTHDLLNEIWKFASLMYLYRLFHLSCRCFGWVLVWPEDISWGKKSTFPKKVWIVLYFIHQISFPPIHPSRWGFSHQLGQIESFDSKLSRSSWIRFTDQAMFDGEFLPQKWVIQNLDGGNSNMFYFHHENWGNDLIWRSYFSDGLKPPTRNSEFYKILMFFNGDCLNGSKRNPVVFLGGNYAESKNVGRWLSISIPLLQENNWGWWTKAQ